MLSAMQIEPSVTFRDIRHSAALEREIRSRIEDLEEYYDSVTGCRVLVELVQRRHEGGNRFHVRIDLTVPGDELVVAHDAGLHATAHDLELAKETKTDETDPAHTHAKVAIREAFDIARRRLQDFAERQRAHR
jgi:ribosome-associated translation inhibitor RaiA